MSVKKGRNVQQGQKSIKDPVYEEFQKEQEIARKNYEKRFNQAVHSPNYVDARTEQVSKEEAVYENNKRKVFEKDEVLDVQCGTLGLYAVYDAEKCRFGHLSTASNHVDMVRFLSNAFKNAQVLDPDWLISKEVYSLYLLGYFKEDGSIRSLLKPVKVIEFSEI